MARRKLKAHIVSQTHWDREWYLPFEEFRFHLVRLVDRLLHIFDTQPGYRHFVTDGQTIILDDYLRIRPEKEKVLREHVRSGRMSIGPWYILPDEYIISGESMVRNLQMGHRIAARFGEVSKAGYVPDPFGHVAQLPQILRGFGIDSFIFLRGMPPAKKYGTEFMWRAPDGTEVLSIWMKNIYFNASLLGYPTGWGDSEKMKDKYSLEQAFKQLDSQYKDLGKWTNCGVLLLNNGCDHTPPQYELPDIIDAANKKFGNVDLEHSTYDKFIADVKNAKPKTLPVMTGELRSSWNIVILPGVLSTRMYLKQWNRRCEHMLEQWAEPLSALARHSKREDHHATLLQAWRLLLMNHPHDSICGCSVDAVHREMMTRFERVAQIADSVIDHHLAELQSAINTDRPSAFRACVAWNNLPGMRRGPMQARLTLPQEDPDGFKVVNARGDEVPFQAGSVSERTETRYLGFNKPLRDIELTLDTAAEGWGYETFWLRKDTSKTAKDSWSAAARKDAIDTDHYRVRIRPNGSLDLFDRETGARYSRLHIFEDTEDVGDEYDYSHAKNSRTFSTEKAKARVRITERGPVYVTYRIEIPWRLPAGANTARTGRLRETRPFVIVSHMKVYRSHRRIEFVTEFDNTVEDHRLRVLFDGPTGARHSTADGHFAFVQRPFETKTTKTHDSPEPTTHHMRFFTSLNDGKRGMAVLNRELLEYEILRGARQRKTIAITLIRSVNWLSKDDLLSRPSFAGPQIETPEAQCPGPYRTEYAILPFSGSDLKTDVLPEAESFASPVILRAEDLHEGSEPAERRFLLLDREDLILSTWKPAESGKGSVVRFYNPDKGGVTGRLRLDPGLKVRGACDLKEDLTGKKTARKDAPAEMKIKLPDYAIRSWLLR